MIFTKRDYRVLGERSNLFRTSYRSGLKIADRIGGKDGGLILDYSENPVVVIALFEKGEPAVQIAGNSARIGEAASALEIETGVKLEEIPEEKLNGR